MTKLISLIFFAMISGCVSVKIGDQTTKKSTRFTYTSPGKNYYRIKDEAVDLAWLSQTTSSTLSVKTKCAKNMEIDLESWFLDLASNFKSTEVQPVQRFKFNNRKALRSEIVTAVEGFENKLAITSFVKNSCQYIIVLTSPTSSFATDINDYESFLSGFKAW